MRSDKALKRGIGVAESDHAASIGAQAEVKKVSYASSLAGRFIPTHRLIRRVWLREKRYAPVLNALTARSSHPGKCIDLSIKPQCMIRIACQKLTCASLVSFSTHRFHCQAQESRQKPVNASITPKRHTFGPMRNVTRSTNKSTRKTSPSFAFCSTRNRTGSFA